MNGRFKGGWITRTYGRPEDGVHAVQMELALRGYLPDESDPPRWDPEFATTDSRDHCERCSNACSHLPDR